MVVRNMVVKLWRLSVVVCGALSQDMLIALRFFHLTCVDFPVCKQTFPSRQSSQSVLTHQSLTTLSNI